jgi:Ca-activated chloride channel family protein
MLSMDVSMSMYATDFKPNRLEAAKEVAIDFINGRNGDKIGLVQYAGEAFTSCPPTLDYPILIEQLTKADGMEMEPGTAIGTGLGTAVVQLRNDQLKSKVIILLTDGSNNSGDISPQDAALLAKEKNICVYTIGIGSNGVAPTPIMTSTGIIYENMPVEIDEQTLTQIATTTGGMYFRATDKNGLKKIYEQIEVMEKRKITHKVVQADPPPTPQAFLNWAFVLILIYLVVSSFLFLPQIND